MHRLHLPVVVLLCLSGGCITAARKIEQAVRRSQADDGNRPAKRAVMAFEDLPAIEAGDVRVDPGHPRLFLGRDVTGRVSPKGERAPVLRDWPAARSPVARAWQATLRKRADDYAKLPTIEYSATKLLTRSRDALKRISLYAGVYRFSGEAKYAEAGRRELMNVCNFQDWQPDNFLALSEMMTAVAIGYDWLHDAMPAAERKRVVAAIASKGLKPALDAYDSQGGWTRAQHNWNLVCNGGVIVGALAIAEEDPALASKLLAKALSSIRYGLSAYDPAGGTAEGPMYHSYASRYLVFAAAALHTAADDDRLLFAGRPDRRTAANWANATDYRLLMTSPTGKSANFGDGSEVLGNTAWMLWLAKRFNDADAARFQVATDRADPSAFDLLWLTDGGDSSARVTLRTPPRGPPFVFGSAVVLRDPVRGQTADPLAPFLALRTGSTDDHHSHLDLGNFVLDLEGERFATDLGADNYDLPGYLGSRRADYLRSSTAGHNTLTMGRASQPGDISVGVKVSNTADGRPVARVDLTDAYPGAKSVIRTATLDQDGATIVDEINLKRSAALVWHLHTPAKVTTKRGGAMLESNGKRVEMKVVEPAGATLSAEPDVTRRPQLPVEGVTHVRVTLPTAEQTRVRVEFRVVK